MFKALFLYSRQFTLILALLFLPCAVMATDFFAAPNGSASGSGTAASPWDLRTALKSSAVRPGDTIYLRDGAYYGKFISTIAGNATNPIVVRSYPGEWARIDGYAPVNATAAIGSTDTSIPLSAATQAVPAANMLID